MIHPWVSRCSLTEGKNSAWFKSNRGWYFRRLSSLSLWSHNFGFCWIIIQILRRVLLYLYLSLSDTIRKKTTRRPFPRSTTTTTDDELILQELGTLWSDLGPLTVYCFHISFCKPLCSFMRQREYMESDLLAGNNMSWSQLFFCIWIGQPDYVHLSESSFQAKWFSKT